MPLPPERISIKRRRHDDPVDTLFLELGSVHDPKRRFTEFCFHRLKQDSGFSGGTIRSNPNTLEKQRSISTHTKPGVPTVRATSSGDEIKDTLKLKAAHRDHLEELTWHNAPHGKPTEVFDEASVSKSFVHKSQTDSSKHLKDARRFHLTRDNKPLLASKEQSGIYKSRPQRKSHVAIFMEKIATTPTRRHSASTKVPVDRIVRPVGDSVVDQYQTQEKRLEQPTLGTHAESKATSIPPFLKTESAKRKTGKSIRDPPATWDQNSDELADELAALALEFEPVEGVSTALHSNVNPDESAYIAMDTSEDEFIYDTYLRIPVDQGGVSIENKDAAFRDFGVLVIDEDSSDLWQTYAESDDDSEWDEEDADSNAEDNPANDYPEDEVSSGDEYGYNSYSHRRNASDEEEYDMDNQLD